MFQILLAILWLVFGVLLTIGFYREDVIATWEQEKLDSIKNKVAKIKRSELFKGRNK